MDRTNLLYNYFQLQSRSFRGDWDFNYNIQGTHKIAQSLDHKKRFLNLLVTFTGTDPVLLPNYDITAICSEAMHQAAQSTHSLKYAFDSKTVDSVMNIDRLEVLPTETAGQVTIQTAAPPSLKQRSNFRMPISMFNIQIGDQAKGVSLFDVNGLPAP